MQLNGRDWFSLLGKDKIHLATIGVAKVEQPDVTALGVLLKVDPLEQMTCDAVAHKVRARIPLPAPTTTVVVIATCQAAAACPTDLSDCS